MKPTLKSSLMNTTQLFSAAFIFVCLSQAMAISASSDELIHGDGNAIYSAEIDQWDEETKQTQRENAKHFLDTLSEAVEQGEKEITLDKEHYRFSTEYLEDVSGAFIRLNDVTDLTIHGNGAQFWFEDYLTALQLDNCHNISFLDLTMDWDPLPFSQVVVTAIDPEGNYIEGKTESGFRNLNEILNDPSVGGSPTVKAFIFDPETGILKPDTAHSEISSIQEIGDGRFRYHGMVYGAQDYESINIEPGDRMAFVMRHRHAIRILQSEDVTFEDLRLYSSPFFGIAMENGGGNMVLKDSKLIPRPGTKRLMSVNGDALHFTSLQEGPRIEGCEFSAAGDDILNIHGDFAMVQEQRNPTEAVIGIKNHTNVQEGSTIRIYDYNTLRLKGEFQVQKTVEGSEALKRDAKAVGEEKDVKFWPGRTSLICTLDQPVDVDRYDIVESDFDGGYGAVIRDNYLHNLTTRGFLIQTKDAVVENNEFMNVDNAAVSIMASLKWCEGPIPENVVLKNNTITRPGWTYSSRHRENSKIGAVSVGIEYADELKQDNRPIQNITIENNTIRKAATCGIFMIHSKNSTVRNNTISGYCEVDPWRVGEEYGVQPYSAIYIGDSERIDLTGNTISDPGPYAQDDIIIGKYTDEDSINITH
ncbi:MAG: right-handed parallel beta-helix repeat-containing protein [Candidatus Hydrogenedentota bacterium]